MLQVAPCSARLRRPGLRLENLSSMEASAAQPPLFEFEPDSALDVMAGLLPRLWKPAGEPFRQLRKKPRGGRRTYPRPGRGGEALREDHSRRTPRCAWRPSSVEGRTCAAAPRSARSAAPSNHTPP